MNYIDIIIAIPLLWGLYKGFTKGIILEAAALIALGLAIWGAVKFHDFVTVWMRESLHWTYKYVPIVSFALIFIGVLIFVFTIAKLLERIVKAVSLGFLNKLAGGVFGILKFGLILSVIIFLLNAVERNYSFIPPDVKNKSLLYKPVGEIAPLIIPGLKESKINRTTLKQAIQEKIG